MAIIRNKYFINIPYKILQFKSLSFGSKGLWCWLLSLPQLDIDLEDLQQKLDEDITSFLKELEKEDLVVFSEKDDLYLVFESPEEGRSYKEEHH